LTNVDDVELPERKLGDLLTAQRTTDLPPPVSAPSGLPSNLLSPPMFERLVAETVLRVDGLANIRIYGRSGQDQGGLDLISRGVAGLNVYQVRRIEGLTPAALRKAVKDFAGLPQKNRGDEPARGRRFEAQRFVLVTGCTPDDTHVENELAKLQRDYAGDLEIALYDNSQLSTMLRERGSLVYGVFGPEWARQWCGYESPGRRESPTGRALLNDPVAILGLGELKDRADEWTLTEPSAAAQVYEELATRLQEKGFSPHSQGVRVSQFRAHKAAGESDKALVVELGLQLESYYSEDLMPSMLGEDGGSEAGENSTKDHIAHIVQAMALWFEAGYDLASVTEDLRAVAEVGHASLGDLLVAVGDQIVADDDPTDDVSGLIEIMSDRRLDITPIETRVRVECCLADLRIVQGESAGDAFRELIRSANGGYYGEGLSALVNRRAGRALSAADAEEAIQCYRRSVLDACDAGLFGDAREALRSISYLSDDRDDRRDAMEAARALTGREHLLPGVDRAALRSLEAMVEEDLPQALRSSHAWGRRERTNGALCDEMVALRRYGTVFRRADESAIAVVHLVRSGSMKLATKAAREAGSTFVDLSRFLSDRFSLKVKAAAAAAIAVQADYVPDEDVRSIATRLMELVQVGPPATLFGPAIEKQCIQCLAEFGDRLSVDLLGRMIEWARPRIPRDSGHYRFTDPEMVAALLSCAQHHDPEISGQGVDLLLGAVRQEVNGAPGVFAKLRTNEPAVAGLRELATSGVKGAAEVLAEWGLTEGGSRTKALEAAQAIIDRPVGHERNSWDMGPDAQNAAVRVRALYVNREAGDNEVERVALNLFEQLIALSSDSHDKAESRLFAAAGARILNDCVTDSDRAAAFNTMIALSDDPLLNHADLYDQSTMHRLSRFKFNTGSESLHLDFLFCSAAFARAEEEVDQVKHRMALIAAERDLRDHEAAVLSKVLLVIDERAPVEIDLYAYHPARHLRQASAICWGRHEPRDSSLVGRFVSDSDTTVRGNIAHAIARTPVAERCTELERAAEILRTDPSATVRRLIGAANGGSGGAQDVT